MSAFFSSPGTSVQEPNPYAGFDQTLTGEIENLPAVVPLRTGGTAVDRAMADIVTAQRVSVKRDIPRILKEVDQIAEAFGPKFYYSWPTKNQDGTVGEVCGASIDCAMALVNIWGNCRVGAVVIDENPTHWVFAAQFVDFEKGVTVMRAYRQRRSQSAGKKMMADRAEDMAFQIGQSKAIRNVIVAGLKIYCDRAVQAARNSAFKWVQDNPERALQVVLDLASGLRIPVARMERLTGRKAAAWLAPDLISVRAKLISIQDGFDDVDTAFPAADADDATDAKGQPETGPAKAPAESKPAETKAAEPEKPKRQPRQTAPKPAEEKAPETVKDTAPDTAASATVQDEPADDGEGAQDDGAGAHASSSDPTPDDDDLMGKLRFE